jgi:NAD(P)H-dependent FMN reductase
VVLELKLIIGSTREGRSADRVTPWLVDRATAHGAFNVDVLDLRDWPLPMFRETRDTVGDFADPTYSDPIVKRWNQTIKSGDAFLILTAEYNHSVPGELKNAIDSVFVSFGFRNKPAAFVAYSTAIAAGIRAVEHLAHIMIETDAVPLRNTVLIPFVLGAFDDDRPNDPMVDVAAKVMLDDLAWWGTALQKARAEGELPPGIFRLRAAATDTTGASRRP